MTAAPGCTTTTVWAEYGVQEGHRGYIPARIAILPCRVWPEGARYATLPLSTATAAELGAVCSRLDGFATEGFSGQPYMRGYSQNFVSKTLAAAGLAGHLDRIDQVWRHDGTSCMDCPNPAAFYVRSLATRPEWLPWLDQLSKAVKNADAVLMPFVTYARTRHYHDRGLETAERGLGVVLLLVDTGSGDLLWAGGREAVSPNRRLSARKVPGELIPPSWELAMDRTFTTDIWAAFPGRQEF